MAVFGTDTAANEGIAFREQTVSIGLRRLIETEPETLLHYNVSVKINGQLWSFGNAKLKTFQPLASDCRSSSGLPAS